MSWTGLVYYGETVGFVVAWIVGVIAMAYAPAASAPTPQVDQVAVAAIE